MLPNIAAPAIVAEDFNSQHTMWAYYKNDTRQALTDWMDQANVTGIWSETN